MHLQGAARRAVRPEVRERIDSVVNDLDTTIRDIRGAIFELRSPAMSDVRTHIRELVAEARDTLGFRPELALDGPVGTGLPEPVAAGLLAVLREALSNVARHAQADAAQVRVVLADGRLALTVVDDGVGIGEVTRASGLDNMRQRAEELGGSLTIEATEPHGTTLTWTVPV
jgi:signal transduction histidine kinase